MEGIVVIVAPYASTPKTWAAYAAGHRKMQGAHEQARSEGGRGHRRYDPCSDRNRDLGDYSDDNARLHCNAHSRG
jgi:hypothetical protein